MTESSDPPVVEQATAEVLRVERVFTVPLLPDSFKPYKIILREDGTLKVISEHYREQFIMHPDAGLNLGDPRGWPDSLDAEVKPA